MPSEEKEALKEGHDTDVSLYSIERNLIRELAHNITRTLARARVRTLALARTRVLVPDLDCTLALVHALDFAQDLAGDLARTYDLDHAHGLAFDLDRTLARSRDLAFKFGLGRVRDFDRDLGRVRDFDRDLGRAHDFVYAIRFVLNGLLFNKVAFDIDSDKALAFIIKNHDIDKATINLLKGILKLSTPLVFKPEDQTSPQIKLTPDYVANVVMPYIQTVARLQNVIDEAKGIPQKRNSDQFYYYTRIR